MEAVAKKKLMKLTHRLQQPGLLPEERARLLSKIEGKLEKLDALPSPQNHGGPAGELRCTVVGAMPSGSFIYQSRLWVECALVILSKCCVGATASSTLKPSNGIQFRTPARSGATGT